MRWSKSFTVVGAHAEGEVGKVVTGGVIDVPGATMFDKKCWLEEHGDDLRRLLLFEPRGAAVNNANIILPSNHPDALMGFVILESTEYPPMSGSNTICVATVLLEMGIVPMREPLTRFTLESPGGLVEVACECRAGKVTRVRFSNVPAFVMHLDEPVELEGVGTVRVDVAYGGMIYVLVDARAMGFSLTPDEARDICTMGQRLKLAVNAKLESVHPENPRVRDVSIAEFRGPLRRRGKRLAAKNTVVVSPGRLDRSPCGTGTSARLAVMHARGQIQKGELFQHESIIGTRFDAEIVGTTRVGPYAAVLSTVAGQAWITSVGQYGLDPTDPLPRGHTLSDTWLQVT